MAHVFSPKHFYETHTELTHIDFGILPSRAKIKSLPFDFTEGIISEMFIQERK